MTRKQKAMADQIRSFVRTEGYFPSVRQIAEITGLSSPATVHAYLRRLERSGVLEHSVQTGWSLGPGQCEVPLVGIVPAGAPNEYFTALGEELTLPEWMIGDGEVVAFRVSGDSMRDAFIQEGDVVVVHPASTAKVGEMVVALLDEGGVTLKRLIRQKNAYALKPENSEYDVIQTPFTLVGRVVGVLRQYR